jgi:hypothetical protein
MNVRNICALGLACLVPITAHSARSEAEWVVVNMAEHRCQPATTIIKWPTPYLLEIAARASGQFGGMETDRHADGEIAIVAVHIKSTGKSIVYMPSLARCERTMEVFLRTDPDVLRRLGRKD